MLEDVEGGYTVDLLDPSRPTVTIFDAAANYAEANIPLVVLAGKEYGSGSSRDWAAKGTALLGVRAVIAESYERIHRSNLIGMGVLPLQFPNDVSASSLGLTGSEVFEVRGIEAMNESGVPETVSVVAVRDDGSPVSFDALVRIDTPGEADYFRHGGILPYVLRSLLP
jgi:aconitate hydratase